MTVLMYLVVSAGLIASVVLLAFARGCAMPTHTVPWIVALVILGLDTALHVVASVGVVIAGGVEGLWFVLGTLAFLAILAVAVLRPRWAGWCLLASAAVVPLVFALGGLAAPNAPGPSETEGIPPWPVALVAYSVPAAVSGGLLVLSARAPSRPSSDSSSRERTPALT
jgi:hypothetical protein